MGSVPSGLLPLAVWWGMIASLATAGGTLVLASVTRHWYLDRESPR